MTRAFRPPQQKSSLSFTVVPSENNLKHFLRITKIITFFFSHGVCSLVVSVLDYRFKGREFKTQTRRIFFFFFSPYNLFRIFFKDSFKKKLIKIWCWNFKKTYLCNVRKRNIQWKNNSIHICIFCKGHTPSFSRNCILKIIGDRRWSPLTFLFV